jgi:hypothetical protein
VGLIARNIYDAQGMIPANDSVTKECPPSWSALLFIIMPRKRGGTPTARETVYFRCERTARQCNALAHVQFNRLKCYGLDLLDVSSSLRGDAWGKEEGFFKRREGLHEIIG